MRTQTPAINKVGPLTATPRFAIIGPVTANIAFVLELTLVPLLLPAMQVHFGLSIGGLAWVFNAYGIAVAIGVFLGGWCGDAFDRRRVFGYGVALFAVGSLLVAVSGTFEMLIIGRVLQGLGAGIFAPLVPLILTQASPLKPGRVLIIWGSIAGYIAAFAPLFYGSFLGGNDWQLGFILTAAIAISALVVVARTPVSDRQAPQAAPKRDYAQLLSARDLWVTFVYVFCTYGSITYYLFRLPVWLSENDISAASVGIILSIMWLTFSGLSTIMRNMVDKPYLRMIMLAAPVLIAVGLPLAYFSASLAFLVLSSIFVGAGLACSNAPSTQLILRFAPKGMSAVSMSLDITFARLGGIITVALLARTEFLFAAVAIGLSCLIAALCSLSVSKGLASAT